MLKLHPVTFLITKESLEFIQIHGDSTTHFCLNCGSLRKSKCFMKQIKMETQHTKIRMVIIQKTKSSQMWWCTPVIPALARQREDYQKFEDRLGYTVSSRLAWSTW
jgi:hypothetical protein